MLLLFLGAILRLLLLSPLPATVTLRGHLDHAPAGDSIRLEYRGHYGRQLAIKAPLSAAGDFAVVLTDLKSAAPVLFTYARQHTSLYLTPGDDLQLLLDFAHFDESVRYEGRGAAANNYLAQSLWKFEYGPARAVLRPQEQLTATTTAAQMRQLADAFRQQQQAFLAAYHKQNPLPPAFHRAAAAHINLKWAFNLLDYPAQHYYLAKQAAVLPATYYDFLPKLPTGTLELPSETLDRGIDDNTLVMRCLDSYGMHLLVEDKLGTTPAEVERLYAQATADFGKTPTRDLAIYILLNQQLKKDLPGVAAVYPTFCARTQDAKLSKELGEHIAKQKRVQPGQPAPAFTLKDHTGKAVSLSDFKGKVVYLDFWGTWCGPCMQEMPASLTLRQQFASRDVVFLYISVGDAEAKWQQVLAAEHLTADASVHLREPGEQLPSDYQVNGYPSYYIIGRDGRFRQTYAPRPSAGVEAVNAIEQALRE